MPESLIHLEESHVLNNWILPVIAMREGMPDQATGSAVMIGHGLALTAKHVIKGFADSLGDGRMKRAGDEPHAFSVRVHQHLPSGVKSWHVARASSVEEIDVSLLQLLPVDGVGLPADFKFPTIRFTPPRVGDLLAGVGFPRSEIKTSDGRKVWAYGSAVTTGKVDAVYTWRRDAGMLPFPCMQTNCFFDGGMSGGAVLNESHELCGIICSCLPASNDEPDTEHFSHASLLWPTVLLDYYAADDFVGDRSPISFSDIVEAGMIGVRDLDCVQIAPDRSTASFVRRESLPVRV